jgi:hypothetical protein
MPGIATGLAFDNYLPQNAFIENVLVEIVVVFNAVHHQRPDGRHGRRGLQQHRGAGDVNEAVAGVYQVTRALGRALTAAGDVLPYAMYTQTGTAATTGQAIIVIVLRRRLDDVTAVPLKSLSSLLERERI